MMGGVHSARFHVKKLNKTRSHFGFVKQDHGSSWGLVFLLHGSKNVRADAGTKSRLKTKNYRQTLVAKISSCVFN